MELKNFLIEQKDGIAWLIVNRETVLNAMNEECWRELGAFADMVEESEDIHAVIITGAGEKAFVAGADVQFLKARTSISALTGLASHVLQKLEDNRKPIIAAINGYALGAGCELALACDIRVASENAVFGLPELSLGILPGAGGTQRLAKLVGLGRAKEMILTSRRVKAEEAYRIGLVTAVVPLAELRSEAEKVARRILTKGPVAVQVAKQGITAALSTDAKTGSMLEVLGYSVLVSSEDRMEGVNAFLEKRPAEFKGK